MHRFLTLHQKGLLFPLLSHLGFLSVYFPVSSQSSIPYSISQYSYNDPFVHVLIQGLVSILCTPHPLSFRLILLSFVVVVVSR